jgi:hypothetical protein
MKKLYLRIAMISIAVLFPTTVYYFNSFFN